MKASLILECIISDGLTLSVSSGGNLEILGDQDKIDNWIETIKENKAAILAELRGGIAVIPPAPKRTSVLSLVKSKECELQEARDTIQDLAEKNTFLRDCIALERLPEEEISDAYDTTRDLRAQVKTLEASLNAITTMRDALMRENAEMKKQLLSQRNQIKKLDRTVA